MLKLLKLSPSGCGPIVVGVTVAGVPRGSSVRGCGRTVLPWRATTAANLNKGWGGRSVRLFREENELERSTSMTMPIVALFLSLAFTAYGLYAAAYGPSGLTLDEWKAEHKLLKEL